uniref:Reverse transcriptase domain-containing protein n=1 Tax=Leptobrachium leishanense TaxID=445787 RepID=A0A8C5MCX6_9ANUR
MAKQKARFYAFQNKPGRLLARKFKPSRTPTKVAAIRTAQGLIHNPIAIANEFAIYYESLYNLAIADSTPNPTADDINAYLANLNLPSLTTTQAESLSAPISQEELSGAIKALPKHKAPGPDGLTDQYYTSFSTILIPHLLTVFAQARETSLFPVDMLRAHIITLPKPGKTPDACKNLRPISLLNVDLKLYSKILATRLQTFLPKLIGPDQVGFISGRQGPDSTKKLINLMETQRRSGQPGLLLSLDAEKAFDRVNWLFMELVMTKFNIPTEFRAAIQAIYDSPSARVLISGFLSEEFVITNGTRQGCPLSPLLYALVLEPLAQAIRQNDEVRGTQAGPAIYKLHLYADDILVTLTDPHSSIPALQDELTAYSQLTYHLVNVSKTQALPHNIPQTQLTALRRLYTFDWRSHYLTYLGLRTTWDPGGLIKHNYDRILTEVKSLLSQWRSREVLWLGRMAAVKMSILPKILYIFRTLPLKLPRLYLDTLQSTLMTFVWNHKRPRVPRCLLYNRQTEGGLHMVNIHKYYRASCLASLSEIFHKQPWPQWLVVEASCLEGHNLANLLWVPSSFRPKLQALMPSTALHLGIWDRHLDVLTSHYPLSMAAPLPSLSYLLPQTLFDPWLRCGVYNLHHLFTPTAMLSFDAVRSKYSISDSMFLSYMQIYSYLKANKVLTGLETHKPLLSEVELFCLDSLSSSKPISLFYRILNTPATKECWAFQKGWERDLSQSFSTSQWKKAYKF